MNINEYINKLKINEINEEKCKKILKLFGESQVNEYLNEKILNDNKDNLDKVNKIMNIIDFLSPDNISYNISYNISDNIIDNNVNDILKAYRLSIGNIRILTKEEEQKYGKLIADNKEVFNLPEQDPNNIFITKRINNNEEKILNIEKIFASITTEEEKQEIFSILNNYFFFEDIYNEATSDKIIKYYLAKYQKLTKELNRIPNTNDLNNYFQDNNLYSIFNNFSNNNKYENIDLLKKQLKQYVLYMHARNMMVIHNQKLVYSIAKRLNNFNDLMDTINNGYLGLIKAIEMFDYKRNTKFSTYAVWWIRQSINREINNTEHLIRISVRFQEEYDKLKKFRKEFFLKNNKFPNYQDISNELGMTIEKIKQICEYERISLNPASLNVKVGEEEETELIDYVVNKEPKPDKQVENNELIKIINEILDCLTDREREIICKRFGLFGNDVQTLREVGENLEKKISRFRVREIENNALKKLKQRSKKNELEAFIN